jgi:Tfp pilus assembly protein PilW
MSNEKGQTLIEVLVGLAAGVIVIGAITIVTINALNNAQFSENQNLATEYAQQAMENMRNMRDTDYGNFSLLSGAYCMGKVCTNLNNTNLSVNPNDSYCCTAPVSGCGQNVGIFVRTISL